MAVNTKGLRAAESALRPKALNKFLWLKVPIYNLVYNLLYNPVYNSVYNPVYNPAIGG